MTCSQGFDAPPFTVYVSSASVTPAPVLSTTVTVTETAASVVQAASSELQAASGKRQRARTGARSERMLDGFTERALAGQILGEYDAPPAAWPAQREGTNP